MPQDVFVGDGEDMVAIPAKHAEEVAHAAFEQEQCENFHTRKVAVGNSIHGVYLPNEDTLSGYEAWRKNNPDLVDW